MSQAPRRSTKSESTNPEDRGLGAVASEGSGKQSLLEEIERRQDEVIAELDALNARIERLLVDWNRNEQSRTDAIDADAVIGRAA